MAADHRRAGHYTALRPRAVMGCVARTADRQRAVYDLAQLLGEGDAHRHHGAARTKRWNHRVAFFHRLARADGYRFLTTTGKNLRRHLAFVLPANARFFNQASHEHVSIKEPLDCDFVLETYRRVFWFHPTPCYLS